MKFVFIGFPTVWGQYQVTIMDGTQAFCNCKFSGVSRILGFNHIRSLIVKHVDCRSNPLPLLALCIEVTLLQMTPLADFKKSSFVNCFLKVGDAEQLTIRQFHNFITDVTGQVFYTVYVIKCEVNLHTWITRMPWIWLTSMADIQLIFFDQTLVTWSFGTKYKGFQMTYFSWKAQKVSFFNI